MLLENRGGEHPALNQASFLSGLESLRDLHAAVGSRFESFKKFVDSLEDSEQRQKVLKLINLSEELAGLIPENEKIFCQRLGSQALNKASESHLPLAVRQREACQIDLDKVLIIPKISKLEYFRRQRNVSIEEAVLEFRQNCEDVGALLKAHDELEIAKSSLLQFFRPEQIKDLSELGSAQGASLVIALGGDDHFCSVSQQVKGGIPVLGLKADRQSVGALLPYDLQDLGEIVKNLDSAEYVFEAWTKLKVTVNGQELPSATSTVFIGDKHSQYTSRTLTKVLDSSGNMLLDLGQQRSSGLLLYTGTGSTGWALSASLYLYPEGHTFSPDARYAEFLVREPNITSLLDAKETRSLKNELFQNNHFILHEGERIVIQSLNKDGGIINADSVCVPFTRGSEAVIQIDPEPLWVIVPKKNDMKNKLGWIYKNFPDPKEGLATRSDKDKSYPERFSVGDRADWQKEFRDYAPAHFEHPKLATASYAEPSDISREEFQKRLASGELKSFTGDLKLDLQNGQPLNPVGRTGISGRGVLGKFGPNFAADPVVIYRKNSSGDYFLLVIERKDGGWALPGGMVDGNEAVLDALFRELKEETSAEPSELRRYLVEDWKLDIYADDRRATDNAWMETSARMLFLPEEVALKLNLEAGDDAKDLKWLKLTEETVRQLYGAHPHIVVSALRHLENGIKQ